MKLIIQLLCVFLLTGCAGRPQPQPSLPQPIGKTIIYSLINDWEFKHEPQYQGINKAALEKFRDHYFVLSKAEIDDQADASRYVSTLQGAFGKPKYLLACFDPRHAISYESSSGHVEALICFECGSVEIYAGEPTKDEYFVKYVRPEIDAIYKKYGVKLPVEK